jgi:hypothetical protein
MEGYIHMFDDYPEKPGNMTEEKKHEKRIVLESRIYSALKQRYMEPLRDFWSNYTVPSASDTNRSIVIIERRIHPNLEFILYNAAYFARGWGITIICSDSNSDYIKGLLDPVKHAAVNIILAFQGNPEPSVGKNEYNYLLQTLEFYEGLPCEHLLFMEMDTYLRKPLPESILAYDYLASPYAWDESMQGGGLSYRKKSAMIRVCSEYLELRSAQDIFADRGMKALGLCLAPFYAASKLFCESYLYYDPVGFHQWWTFFHLGPDDAEDVCNKYMTLEM